MNRDSFTNSRSLRIWSVAVYFPKITITPNHVVFLSLQFCLRSCEERKQRPHTSSTVFPFVFNYGHTNLETPPSQCQTHLPHSAISILLLGTYQPNNPSLNKSQPHHLLQNDLRNDFLRVTLQIVRSVQSLNHTLDCCFKTSPGAGV